MIYILSKEILNDIKNMKAKTLDKDLIESRDNLTFFKVKDEVEDNISKILLESLLTENLKNDTLDSLEFDSGVDIKEIESSKILKAYEVYNNSLNLASLNYISGAERLIDKAFNIYKRDTDILNLRGLIKLLKCDFYEAFESFYLGLAYGDEVISKEYIEKYKSEEFTVFLERYNHAVRFINDGMNYEAIEILKNINEEEPDFVNPYVMLILLYNKMDKYEKSDLVIDTLKHLDKDNEIVKKKKLDKEREQLIEENTIDKFDREELAKRRKERMKSRNNKKNSGKILAAFSVVALILIVIIYNAKFGDDKNINKDNNATSQVTENNSKNNDGSKDKDGEVNSKKDEKTVDKNSVDKKLTPLEEDKNFENALALKNADSYEEAIKYFDKVINGGSRKKYISESIYQAAVLSHKIKNDDDAIKYYKKYINTYTKEENYYDDSYYELGMIYYDKGDLKNAKKVFYSLRSEVPNSMYNNSKLNEILKEKN